MKLLKRIIFATYSILCLYVAIIWLIVCWKSPYIYTWPGYIKQENYGMLAFYLFPHLALGYSIYDESYLSLLVFMSMGIFFAIMRSIEYKNPKIIS